MPAPSTAGHAPGIPLLHMTSSAPLATTQGQGNDLDGGTTTGTHVHLCRSQTHKQDLDGQCSMRIKTSLHAPW